MHLLEPCPLASLSLILQQVQVLHAALGLLRQVCPHSAKAGPAVKCAKLRPVNGKLVHTVAFSPSAAPPGDH